MAPLAPVITPLAQTAPVSTGTVVANLAQPPEETDPGPFDYQVVTGADQVAVAGTTLTASVELSADVAVGVTATSDPGGTSPEGTGTITVAAAEEEREDDYANNPQIPPPMAEGDEWTCFIVPATTAIRPHARNGVDYVVSRPDRATPLASTGWNDAVLGPRPDAEIEAEARRLAGEWPTDVNPMNAL